MGRRNYLIEGVSGTGKTSVCEELKRRGFHAIHGDRELAYQGDPETGEPLPGSKHKNHIWDLEKLGSLVSDRSQPITFFCGGSRNFSKFIHLFDGIFVLDVDLGTLNRRLAARPADELGGTPGEREMIARLHASKEDLPENAIPIDATLPLAEVVDRILSRCEALG
ncbi:AAA family ATPase [Aureimonas sp. AU40]|uniref:AAA family ATPase n=1 Tax=Aureimonas sp. AU40 TaxID=1637747 RepID=UPI0007805C9B|nr:nucleoside kinase [Aureimonas sp. AU40]